MKKRAIGCYLTLSLVLAGALASCGEAASGQNPADEVTGGIATEPVVTEEADLLPDNLPEMDFGGYKFQMYCRECCTHKDGLWIEKETGDVVNDAVYSRNKTIEERFNIEFLEPLLGPDGDVTFLRSSFMAGDMVADIVVPHFRFLGDLALQGFLTDMSEVPYLNFDQPWWNTELIHQYSIFNRYFVANGCFAVDNITDVGILLFNKGLYSENFDENLYDCVREGRWTIDKLNEIVQAFGSDLNGDGKISYTDDMFAFTGEAGMMFLFQVGMGQPTTKINADGEPELCSNCEKMVTIVEKLYSMICDYPYSYVESGVYDSNTFVAGKSLFHINSLKCCVQQTLREMQSDYGILPLPKFDEAQDAYYSHASAHSNLMGIPNLNPDLERTGIILEALSAEGYKTIRPAVYDVALKQKGARDEDSAEMIDIAYNGRTGDFADLYDEWGLVYTLDNMIGRQKINTFASYYKTNENASVGRLSKAVKAFRELE